MVLLGKHAVLAVQLIVHVDVRSACERLLEALLEVLAKKGVQDRVYRTVRIRKAAGQQHHGHGERELVLRCGRRRFEGYVDLKSNDSND